MRRAAKLGPGLALALLSAIVAAETIDGRVHSVVDGDTLIVSDTARRLSEIHLLGIDAPALTQPFGQAARTALSALAANQSLRADCRRTGAQDLCRLRVVGKEDQDIALELVRAGMAWWNPQHATLQTATERADYEQAEFNAKIRRFGLWNSKNPVPPWQWRLP